MRLHWCRFGEAIGAGRISKVEKIDNCCVLAAVGHQMASRKGVAATMFSALAKANINIRWAISLVCWILVQGSTTVALWPWSVCIMVAERAHLQCNLFLRCAHRDELFGSAFIATKKQLNSCVRGVWVPFHCPPAEGQRVDTHQKTQAAACSSIALFLHQRAAY